MLSADGGGGTVPQDPPDTACRASGAFTCRDDDRFTYVEQDGALSAFSGYRFDGPDPDLAGSLAAAIHPDDLPGVRDAIALQLAAPGARVAVAESRIVAKDGTVKWVWMSAEPCVVDGVRCLHCVFHDATAQHAMLDELAASESRYAYILSKSEDTVFEWDCATGGLACSPLFERKFGRRLPATGFPESMLKAGVVHPDDVGELGERLADLVGGAADAMSCECRLQRADGVYRWVRITATLLRDAQGTATRAMGLISDIDEQKRSVQQARERALRDPLTDLYNQGATKVSITRRLADSDGLAAFVFVDVDDFKNVNDTLGHRYGDAVLSDIAFHLRGLFPDDIVGRIGGDEFAVFLDRLGSKAEVEGRMEAVLELFRRSFGEREVACAVSASIGIAYCPDDGSTYQELFEKADRAMYAAKTRGKNRWCAYDAAMEVAASPRVLTDEDTGGLVVPKTLRGNTVEYLFSILLDNPVVERAIPILFDLLGRQFGCARISLCEKEGKEGKKEAFTCTFEWCAANVPSLKEIRGRISCDELARVDADVAEAVAAGRPFLLEAASPDAGVLAGRGMRSACVCPVQEGGATVAFVAFESTATGGPSDEDRRTLRLVSEAIVLFLMNRRKQEALERRQLFSDELLKRVNAHVYGVDPKTHRVAFVSGDVHAPASLKKGDLCYRALRGFDRPCSDCPILDLRDEGDRVVKTLYHPQSNRWSETAVTCISPEDGGAGSDPLCVISSHDITAYVADERSAGEALQLIELRNQLDLYRTASRGGAFVVRMDGDFTLLYGNDIFYEVLEYTPDELRERHGNRCGEYLHPEDLPGVKEYLDRTIEAGERSARWEMRVVTGRGNVRWVLVMGTFENRGDDVVLNGFVTDTTETHELRERIERSEERYRIALRQTKVNVWEYDFASRSIIVTESSSSQHGYRKLVENVPESLIADGHIDPVSVQDFRRLYARLRAGEPSVRADILTRRADGAGSWWERISYTTIYDAQGVPVRAVAVGEDVTRQKEMERAYRQELKMRAASEDDGVADEGVAPEDGV